MKLYRCKLIWNEPENINLTVGNVYYVQFKAGFETDFYQFKDDHGTDVLLTERVFKNHFAEIKEIPVLFSTLMVQALIAVRKTMTRRTKGLEEINKNPNDWEFSRLWNGYAKFCEVGNHINEFHIKCPYGQVGDILWVKETYYAWGNWVINGITKKGRQKLKFVDHTIQNGWKYQYWADKLDIWSPTIPKDIGWYKRPSLFMPKYACRIKLKITNIRVERLQDISEADAIAEGIIEFKKDRAYKNYTHGLGTHILPKESFQSLWESINGQESWEQNPWVWVIEFERCKDEN